MEKTLKKTALVISVVLALLLVIAYVVYDYLLLAPNISLAYQGSIGQQKLDAEFKVIVELESLAYLSREYMVNLEIVSGTEIKTTLPAQIKILESRKKQTAEFTCMLSEPVIPGSYSAVVYITAKKSIFSGTYSRIVELRQDFIIAEKIISGVINFIDIKGGKKLGEVMGINGFWVV